MNELPPLPEIADAAVDTLRLQGTLVRRMPPMPTGDLPNLYFTNTRQLEAERYANEIREAYDISRQIDAYNRAVAKAQEYQAQKAAERGNRINKTFAGR